MPAAAANRSPSRREKQLAGLKARRAALARRREDMLDDIVSGCSYGVLAQKHVISVRTVRREVDRARDRRHLDRPDRYVRIQVERLTHALKTIDHALLQGDYLAVDPMLKVIERLDRYHGLARFHDPLDGQDGPARLEIRPNPLALDDGREDSKDHLNP